MTNRRLDKRALARLLVGMVGGVGVLLLARAAFAALPGVDGIEEAMTDAVDSAKTIAKVIVGFVGAVILVAGMLSAAHKFNTGQAQGFWQLAGVLAGAALVTVSLTVLT